MADAPKILSTDTLRESLPKVNQSIDNANTANTNASEALTTANESKSQSTNTQEQLDQVVIAGDSSVEAAQARVAADGQTFTTLRDRLNDSDAQLAETSSGFKSFRTKNFLTVSTPDKKGVKTCHPKLVVNNGVDDFAILQYAGSHYVKYDYNKANGDTASSSTGGSWDLIRLKKSQYVSDVLLAKKTIASSVGTIETLIAPSVAKTTFDDNFLIFAGDEDGSQYMSSSGDGIGLGVQSISASSSISSVTWNVTLNRSINKGNLVVYGTPGSSRSVDILINGNVVKNIDLTTYAIGTANQYGLVEFDLPNGLNGTVDVTLRNNDTAGKKAYFVALNVMKLKEYKGEDIDFWKAFVCTSKWIESTGSSEYAILDSDTGLFCGSFHGGETRINASLFISAQADATNTNPDNQPERCSAYDPSSFTAPWVITEFFKIHQVTNINNKANMYSIFDFDTDGTIEMYFNYYNSTIKAAKLYTALTATSVDFNFLAYPKFIPLPSDGSNVYMHLNEGTVIQKSTTQPLSLDLCIRFTQFYDEYSANGAFILNDTSYKKFYYGIVNGLVSEYGAGVVIPDLTFSKGLDFKKTYE